MAADSMLNCDNQTEVPTFGVNQECLAILVQVNDSDSLQQFGGMPGLMAALETNAETGISGDAGDLYRRHKAFGRNLYLEEQTCAVVVDGFFRLALQGFKDTTIILLLCCALLSAVIGIKRNGPVEGLRDGVPADGLFIEGNSSFKLDDDFLHGDSSYYKNPSLFTGAKVNDGNCQMLLRSVGKNTERSRLMRSLSSTQKIDNQESKLQISIDNTSSRLEKIWLSLWLFILVVQLFRCFMSVCDDSCNPDPKSVKNSVEDLINGYAKWMKKQGTKASGLVAVLSILLFALRDGLPLGIFVSFVYASNKMKSHNVIVQRLPSCATIGLVSTICTGITNDLALHHSNMADLWIGFDGIKDVSTEVPQEVLKILQDGICAYASCNGQENALCYWAHQELDIDISEFNTSCAILHINKSPDLYKNSCGLVLKKHKEAGRVLHIHWNGEFEKMLSMCSHYRKGDGTIQTLDEDKKDLLNREFLQIASNCLQVLAFAYRQIDQEEDRVVDTDITTARIMALYSGILRPEEDIEGAIIEASDFRKNDKEERLKTIENIHGESGVQDAGDPIITRTMWRNVAVQSLIQITILMFLHFKGTHFFHEAHETVLKSMINGCYVFCQIFGLIGAMMMFKEKTCMSEEFFASRKCLLISLGIVGIIVVLEVGLVEIMAIIAHWRKLNSKEWCFCIRIAALSVPIVCAAN
ncbi:calcium-transporting ATPase 12, plasma membrane-type-like [Olea europaea subsp. europaea]|uniref:Calcium-transporting ATPase 12, plasma membrane-type-like n=1 Tax=Olea europaea subsp. europaea TaxID=158383 RepID=A0A8S0TLV5_OLEEU|nr:calcium-transporting ATPase 12, plasma membrane-type-like [Olea europaea subsp. europaea]